MNYNKVILVGRLVREPKTVMLRSGTQMASFVLAYNRNYKDQSGNWKEESHFFEIKAFGWLVEKVIPNIGKGDLILVEGRLHQDKWLDKQSGEPRSKVRILALDIKLLSRSGAKNLGAPQVAELGEEIPSLESEVSISAEGEVNKNSSEEDFEDLDKMFGEDENKPPQEGKKKDEEDDLDILL